MTAGAEGKLFGTDGVRARAGEGPLAPGNVRRLGRAIARAATPPDIDPGKCVPVYVGCDPRPSSAWIERELAEGLAREGAYVVSAGVLPTPGVSYLVRKHGFGLGIVISASHNPAEDNGVKLFAQDGSKVSDELEIEVERAYAALATEGGDPPARRSLASEASASAAGRLSPAILGGDPHIRAHVVGDPYRRALVALDGGRRVAGRKVVLDCASGATGRVATEVFRELGADAVLLNADGDGAHINAGCGALHPEVAAAAVRERAAFAGFSFDGDGDRVIAVDETGAVHDGDDILSALALFLKARGELAGDAVVATILSNMGLETRLRAAGIALHRVPVGDRHVSRRLLEGGFALGGEQSGHIVLPRVMGPTGDGIACAIELLRAAAEECVPMSKLLQGFRRFPQVAKNVRVARKPALETLAPVQAAIAEAERALEGRGRIVVRFSGTEPLARVMVEAEDGALAEGTATGVAAALAREIGAA